MEDDIHKSLQLFLAWWKLRLAGEVFTGSLDKQKAVGLNRRLGDVIQGVSLYVEWAPKVHTYARGYNGTIFAYGQTGSGKTFTITGGAERYSDRGIIPRTLSYIFEQLQKDSSKIYTTHISYLEIYNECGYDLLDPRHEASKLEDLPTRVLFKPIMAPSIMVSVFLLFSILPLT
ncbi:kinesin-like protein KIF6-like protein [Cricetulus griseus]|uniref:Kinesin-like protein KIF6-like protein n=1 Tax=Cricetulus griseus TaxID=10029 RepID=A0A061IN40_CRIGR|nr:kinesin-like protein KIF6-like protein [Cricetulus griseus]